MDAFDDARHKLHYKTLLISFLSQSEEFKVSRQKIIKEINFKYILKNYILKLSFKIAYFLPTTLPPSLETMFSNRDIGLVTVVST